MYKVLKRACCVIGLLITFWFRYILVAATAVVF